jgi:integrase
LRNVDPLSMRGVANAPRLCDSSVESSIEEVTVIQQGQVFKLKARGADGRPLWAYRYRLDGRASARPQVGGFVSRAEAEEALRKVLARRRPGGCAATMTLADLVEEYLGRHQGEPVTVAKLHWLLGKATASLGAVRLADLSPKEIYAWRQTIPEGHRFDATQALRQVLRRAVEWEWLSDNPAKCVPNPQRRSKEKRPFESWEEVGAVAAELRPVYGTMVIFAAATGLRPSELFGLEWRDVDRPAGVVYVRRAFANGRLKHPKTRLSNRAVPLQAKALEALDQLPPAENEILFPNARGGRIDFRSFGRRQWKPAQQRAGIEPLRGLYDLRHTYATFALRAGVPVFAVSRFMGSSIAMIDYHYGHLAHDSHEHAVSLLDALAIERAVDAGWTPTRTTAKPHPTSLSGPPRRRSRRAVDARWTSRPRLVAATANRNS